jgi:hypothetical protein
MVAWPTALRQMAKDFAKHQQLHASYEVAHVEIMEGLSNYVATQDISASGNEFNVLHMAYGSVLSSLSPAFQCVQININWFRGNAIEGVTSRGAAIAATKRRPI